LGCARFDRDAAAPGPQAVLIAFGLNDCYPGRHGLDRWLEGRVPQGPARSYVWRAGRARLERLGRRLGRPAAPAPEPERRGAPRTTPEGFAAALESLVLRTRAIDAQPILLSMTPLAAHDTPGVQMRLAAYPAYNACVRQIAAERHLPLVELSSGAPPQAFDADGFHLTRDGQTWVAGQVYDQLQALGQWTWLAHRAWRSR
jgi:lysophospholipase L1-like esterase